VLNLGDEFGYTPETIDAVQNVLGRSNSIFDIVNKAGVVITKSIMDSLPTKDPILTVPQFLTHAIDRRILGKKKGTSIRDMFGSNILEQYGSGLLLSTQLTENEFIYKGYQVAVFPNSVDDQNPMTGYYRARCLGI
jgi:hypothetical protein